MVTAIRRAASHKAAQLSLAGLLSAGGGAVGSEVLAQWRETHNAELHRAHAEINAAQQEALQALQKRTERDEDSRGRLHGRVGRCFERVAALEGRLNVRPPPDLDPESPPAPPAPEPAAATGMLEVLYPGLELGEPDEHQPKETP